MNPSFNLVHEPWLPVLYTGEPLSREVSLFEALRDAHRIRELADPSPLVTAALHRLLLAVLHRVYGPATDDDWAALWEAGWFASDSLENYLNEWESRFDLFDPDHPFYQTPGLPETSATTIAKLGHEFAAGNNPLLFDHSQDDAPAAMEPAEAARRLVAHQAFAVGGLVSRLPGESASANSSHLVKAAVVLVRGRSLFETLVLNLVQYNGSAGQPFAFAPADDLPAWERDEPVRFADRKPDGYLDLLTWQSRRILLFPEGSPPRVARAAIMGGFQFPAGSDVPRWETMAGYRQRKDAPKNVDPWVPVGFSPGRALWRDTFALLSREEGFGGPQVLRDLASRRDYGYLEDDRVLELAAFGLATDRAKVFLWRREELPLPLAYLQHQDLVVILQRAVEVAEEVGRHLRSGVFRLAEAALAPDGNADRSRVSALVESLGAEPAYWARLDIPFRRFMRDLPRVFADRAGKSAREAWADAVQSAARDAFDRAVDSLATTGRGYRAAAAAGPAFFGSVSQVVDQFAGRTTEVHEEVPA